MKMGAYVSYNIMSETSFFANFMRHTNTCINPFIIGCIIFEENGSVSNGNSTMMAYFNAFN